MFDPTVFNECKTKYETEMKINHGIASDNAAFQYGICLIEHPDLDNVKKGLNIMRPLYEQGDADLREQILFYLAKAEFTLKNFLTAKTYCEEMLKIKPNCFQAKHLLDEIDSSMKKDGMIGLAATAGLLAFTGALGTVLTFAFMKGKKGSK
ncbi:hypothetical protein GJ496_011868 [Pomphorhynchus laevis]|nr:hypothetical protein GJ496_011868 [Pomphorhynchus laevis]